MMECRLLQEGGRAHFMTRRFDRQRAAPRCTRRRCARWPSSTFARSARTTTASSSCRSSSSGSGLTSARKRSGAWSSTSPLPTATTTPRTSRSCCHRMAGGNSHPRTTSPMRTHRRSPWTRQHLMAVNGRTTGITRADVREVGERFRVPGAAGCLRASARCDRRLADIRQRSGCPRRDRDHVARDIETWSAPLR